jgi:3-hydroxyisobutyrate dehydrogenase
VCEALAYAKTSGLNPETVLKSISTGAAGSWTLENLAPRILREDYDPGFFVKHFIKDMTIAAEEGKEMGLDLPGLRLALARYQELEKNGFGEEGTQALIRSYKE